VNVWHLYILLCDQKTYYVGISSSLASRIKSHRVKRNIGTKEFSDFKLIYTETYSTRKKAESREKQLKRWTAAKKKALIEGKLDLLRKLSKSREFGEGRQQG